MHTEFDAAPSTKPTGRSRRWTTVFGAGQGDLSREALEREAAAEIGLSDRPVDQLSDRPVDEPEESPAPAPIEASTPPAHRRRDTWGRLRQALTSEPADVRRERLEREAADEIGLSGSRPEDITETV